jgi:hypothetical protein
VVDILLEVLKERVDFGTITQENEIEDKNMQKRRNVCRKRSSNLQKLCTVHRAELLEIA